MKIFSTVFKLYGARIFIAKISKGHNSVKIVGGVAVLILCTLSDDGLYLYKVS